VSSFSLGSFMLEDNGSKIFRNVGQNSYNDTAPYPSILASANSGYLLKNINRLVFDMETAPLLRSLKTVCVDVNPLTPNEL
jgi:hypothetical protein